MVCPPTGIVEPGTTRLVKIYLKAQREYDEDLRLCKDRFLVQSIVVGDEIDEPELTSNMFRTIQRQEAKLKVVVVGTLHMPDPLTVLYAPILLIGEPFSVCRTSNFYQVHLEYNVPHTSDLRRDGDLCRRHRWPTPAYWRMKSVRSPFGRALRGTGQQCASSQSCCLLAVSHCTRQHASQDLSLALREQHVEVEWSINSGSMHDGKAVLQASSVKHRWSSPSAQWARSSKACRAP